MKQREAQRPTYSIVVPVYNEAEVLPELISRLGPVMDRLDGAAEVILVDDGSRDDTYALLLEAHAQDRRFKPVQLSRNFGHQTAITAGLDLARGEAVVVMDADLQDPPEVILEMASRWREGYEVVYAVRGCRRGEPGWRNLAIALYYRLLDRLSETRMPRQAGDFRLLDRRALDALKSMREQFRYVRGMTAWIGFRQTSVRYDRPPRAAGESKYPLSRMVRLALDGILSFSRVPLRLALKLGLGVSAISFVGGLTAVALKLSGIYIVSGWTSMIVVVSFLGGMQLMVLGVIGEYIGRIYEEVKERPLYIVRELHGFRTEDLKALQPARCWLPVQEEPAGPRLRLPWRRRA